MRVNRYELNQNEGIPCLVKGSGVNYPEEKNLDGPAKISNMMRKVFDADKKAEEHVWLLSMDSKMKLLGILEVSHGTVNTASVAPREIFIRLLLTGAASFVLVHNHVSGCVEPSKEDVEITKRMSVVGALMNIPLMDHIIIGGLNQFSFKKEKMLD